MMYQFPQLYGDLSTITWIIPRPALHRYVEALVRAGLGKRLIACCRAALQLELTTR